MTSPAVALLSRSDGGELEARWKPPSKVADYRIVRHLGSGSMGDVYLAEDEVLERSVAVKFVRNVERSPQARRRFLIESRAAARFQHPNVVTLYRVGEYDGRPYLVTEFLEGIGLDRLRTPMHWRRALELGIGLSRGLAAVHSRGVVHRDIKPSNAILTDDGTVKLLDFGLAKLIDDARPHAATGGSREPTSPAPADGQRSTSSARATPHDAGALVGTPAYRSPEVWSGEQATERADVYSCGVLLFELCAGRLPHGDVPQHALWHVVQTQDAPLLVDLVGDLPPELASIIQRCLRRAPSERFATGDDLREALEAFKATDGVAEGSSARSARALASVPRGATWNKSAGAIPGGNPYPGLHRFEAEHRALFFGRRDEIATVTRRLSSESLVIVTGDCGVGKSSLCRAGVLPAVQDGALGDSRLWSAVSFVPGASPLVALVAALAPLLALDRDTLWARLRASPSQITPMIRARLGRDAGVVILVDQLEDLLTATSAQSKAIVDEVLCRLAMGVPGVRVLMTVRGDFLDRVGMLPWLGQHVGRALYFLKPLSREGIREAITGPAEMTGVTLEPEDVVDMLVRETSSHTWGLPLLQFALANLWRARDPAATTITVEAFEKMDSCADALSRYADGVILEMTALQRAATRRIFARLTEPRGGLAPRLEEDLVAGDPVASAALRELVRGRLLVAKDGEEGVTYELVHQVLLTEWKTLQRWLEEQAQSRAVRTQVVDATRSWRWSGYARSALWRAPQLAVLQIVDMDDLGTTEVAFVAASRREVRRAQRWRAVLCTLVALALLAVLGALWLRVG